MDLNIIINLLLILPAATARNVSRNIKQYTLLSILLFTLLTNSFTLITNTIQFYDIYGLGQISNGINLLIVVFVIGANLIVNAVTGASIDKGIGG